LVVFALPAYSVLLSANQTWTISKTENDNLLLDLIGTGTLKTDLQYQINSVAFAKQNVPLTDSNQLQIGFFSNPGFLKRAIETSAELLDWLQRFQALFQLVAPFIGEMP